MSKNTDICWITSQSRRDSEWTEYVKAFYVDDAVDNAVIRFESDCVCAVFINGKFVISGTGRTPERVNCHEVTSLLKMGMNSIRIVLGGHYFQGFALDTRKARGYWLNQAALELAIELTDKSTIRVKTDSSWENTDGEDVLISAQVTSAEYENMWLNACLWQEKHQALIPESIIDTVGNEYAQYASLSESDELVPIDASMDNMLCENGIFTAKNSGECSVTVDMGRTVVGYLQIEYSSENDVLAEMLFDLTEQKKDFDFEGDWAYTVKRLAITETLDGSKASYLNLRRRAFRYARITFRGDVSTLKIKGIKVLPCMFPQIQKGWFFCSDSLLNDIWETGKYTFHLIKQQEYESCPRNEMLFFAGDGMIDALIDSYTFGNFDMLKTSLSLKHEEKAAGISTVDKFNRTVWQWDYFAWRIVCIHNYFVKTGDKEFLKVYYGEAVNNILWLIERMNDRELLFQIPAFLSTSSSIMIQVDWACSIHRLGENAFLNCLLYKSLECMHELASVMNDKRSDEWKRLSGAVKNAINTHLWDDDKKAYVDSLGGCICQDSNVLAVLFGVADKARATEALATVKERLWSEHGSAMADTLLKNGVLRGGNATVSPMMSTHEAEARFLQGDEKDALDLIRRVWGSMLKKGATTFWEFNPNNPNDKWEHSVCHGWSAGCTYLLSAYVLGIRPCAYNWSEIVFAPRTVDIESGKGVVPTPAGLIALAWEGKSFKLTVPSGIKVKTDLSKDCRVEINEY